MSKEYASFFGSVLSERVQSPFHEYGSPACYQMMGRVFFDFAEGGRTVVATVARYSDDSWQSRQEAGHPLHYHAQWSYLGRVHYAWGQHNFGSPLEHRYLDAALDVHVNLPDAPPSIYQGGGLWYAAVFQIGSRAHVATGLEPGVTDNDQRGKLRTHRSWDETNQSWVVLQDVPDPLYRDNASAFVLGGKGYVVGGQISGLGSQQHDDTDSERTGQNYRYSPLTDTWDAREWFPNVGEPDRQDWLMNQAPAVVHEGTKAFLWIGQETFAFRQNWAYHYEPLSDAWTRHDNIDEEGPGMDPPMPVMPRWFGSVVLGGVAHLIGGGREPPSGSERFNIRFDHRGEYWDRRQDPLIAKDESYVSAAT